MIIPFLPASKNLQINPNEYTIAAYIFKFVPKCFKVRLSRCIFKIIFVSEKNSVPGKISQTHSAMILKFREVAIFQDNIVIKRDPLVFVKYVFGFLSRKWW